jgi:SAM-dependent methyltransferase
MGIDLTTEDRRRIEESIRQKYAEFSSSPEGKFAYPTGQAGLEGLHYDPEIIRKLPNSVVTNYCGVGNPFSLGPINSGETVLDIGCGAGVDTFVAAKKVGPEGKVIGIDMTPEMLARARKNLQETTLQNVSFHNASAEDLPFPDESFDVVVSNGVFNLIPDKARALREVFRVLKPHGRMMIADQILTGLLPADIKARIESWFR